MRFFAEPVLALAALLLVAGGIVMQIFTILSGAIHSSPIDKFYFLQAGTSGIPNARNPSRWTFFAVCGRDPSSGNNANCGAVVPALPFDPPRNFGTTENVPEQFIGTHMYFYLSRFMFAFYLIALFFAACALLTGLLAMCSRLGGYLSGLTVSIALFFQALAAALMTCVLSHHPSSPCATPTNTTQCLGRQGPQRLPLRRPRSLHRPLPHGLRLGLVRLLPGRHCAVLSRRRPGRRPQQWCQPPPLDQEQQEPCQLHGHRQGEPEEGQGRLLCFSVESDEGRDVMN
jgi:hypothetical protein